MPTAKRLDIQGLRAVGALLVVVFHIWIGRVSGGVDVFFVISGYLLLGSLARQLESTGKIDVLGFLTNLMRRLLPASLFVLAVIAFSGPFWIPATRWLVTSHQVTASAIYLENWRLAYDAVDYLNRENVGSPVQHYWAMSAQVQALVLFSFLFAGLTVFDRKSGRGTGRTALVMLATISLLSFSYSLVRVSDNQPFTYFDTFARLWEFGVGGLVAAGARNLELPRPVAIFGGWIGLAAIVSCGFVLKVSTSFPGTAALWPVMGAALVLTCARVELNGGVNRVLELPPLKFVGNHSYSLYLWHWPVLVFYLTVTTQNDATFLGGTLVFVVSLVLAYLTTVFVEVSVSAYLKKSTTRTIVTGAAVVGALFATSFAGTKLIRAAAPGQQLVAEDPIHYPGARAFGTRFQTSGYPLRPGPLWVREDRSSVYADGCHQSMTGTKPLSCSYGRYGGQVIALVGGSHSAQWLSALKTVAAAHRWQIITLTKSSCLFSTTNASQTKGYEAQCKEWNGHVLAELKRIKPQLVFTTATRAAAGREIVPSGYREVWKQLNDQGITVVAVRDTPWMGFDVAACVEVNGSESERCSRSRRSLLSDKSPLDSIPRTKRLLMIDLSRSFCTDSKCLPVAGNVLMYHDNHHVSNTYMRTVAENLEVQLGPILRSFSPTGSRS